MICDQAQKNVRRAGRHARIHNPRCQGHCVPSSFLGVATRGLV